MIISKGNSKLGKIPNVSLIPIKDCKNCKFCSKDCYALKSWKMYPNARKAWTENSKLAHTNITMYFNNIIAFILKDKPKYFRWHVAGDILNQIYLNRMILIAHCFPKTRFLCFTKRFDLDYQNYGFSYPNIPNNLAIFFSMWSGMKKPKKIKGINFTWCQDGTEKRIPKNAIYCQGNCSNCKTCWHLKDANVDVVFNLH
jgi:hypothetical protein